jgi:hypothetical protein
MSTPIHPEYCPHCGERFQLSYEQRRNAIMPLSAKLALLGGIVTTILLPLVFLVVLGKCVSEWTDGLGLKLRERGLIFGVVYLLSFALVCLPAWLGWQYAFSRARKLTVTCSTCQRSSICWVNERDTLGPAARLRDRARAGSRSDVPRSDPALPTREPPPVVRVEWELGGMRLGEDPFQKRLERRKRKRDRPPKDRGEPNPDFDFGE